jgi:protein-S-isoprenylcysteine O-methyltransferase Ste14
VSRNWAIRTLGFYHSVYIEIRDVHPLIQAGPYHYVRNPYYLSNLLEIVGLPLVSGSAWGLILAVLMYAPILVLRLMLEEKALTERLGRTFLEYKEQVPRLIPKLL